MSESEQYKLEPGSEEVRQMLELTTEKIISFLDSVAKPVAYEPGKVRDKVVHATETIPEIETEFEEILNDLFDHRIDYAFQATHPGFMAYIPGGGLFHAALADLIAKTTNRYVGIDISAPFLSQIEADVIRWFCQMIGYADTAGGTLTSGGSIANLTAVICARTLLLGDNFSKGTVYASEFVHHSMWKAFHAAGIASSQIRSIPIDNEYRLDTQKLEDVLNEDISNGYTPLMIVASAGSTNTGTIDPLRKIAEIARHYSAWYHIDAAYGGFFAMTNAGKKLLDGIELADSITLDPHKGLFLPYGTGAFIVQDRDNLKRVFTQEADYMPEKHSGDELWDFSHMSLELTRPFRGLGIWLPFKMYGAATFRMALEEKLDLARYFYEQLLLSGRWQIIAAPELSLTVFRYNNEQINNKNLNQINQEIINYVNRKARVILSGTTVNNDFVIRDCILSFRTHKTQINYLLEDLDEALNCLVSKS